MKIKLFSFGYTRHSTFSIVDESELNKAVAALKRDARTIKIQAVSMSDDVLWTDCLQAISNIWECVVPQNRTRAIEAR